MEYLDPQALKRNLDGCYPVPYQDTATNIRRSTNSHLMFFTLIQPLDERLKMFWELETLGIKEDETSVYDNFINSIQLRDGRYCVKLPWKDPYCTLPSNYDLCQKRLHVRRLKQNTRLLKEYDGVIREQLAKGIVEVGEICHLRNTRGYIIYHTTQ